MVTFEVVVRAIIVKTLEVEADTEELAIQRAHELFSPMQDGEPEKYTEELISVALISKD